MLFTIMNSLKKYIRLSAIVAFFIAALTSCREDDIFNPTPSDEGVAGGITFRCSDMLETFVVLQKKQERAFLQMICG